jgi:inner membrane protein
MKGRTHLIAGAGTGLSLLILSIDEPTIGIAAGALSILGSIAPDIDNRKSIIGNKMKITSTVTNKIFGHRGITHTPALLLAMFLIGVVALVMTDSWKYFPVLCGFAVGYASHLFLDMLTKGGIPLLFPFSRKRINLTPFKTGGFFEIFLGIAVALLSVGIALTILFLKFPM